MTESIAPRLDWFAYYERFKEAHGEPVLYKGRLLFPDGWTYSSTDFAGPEWPPPTDVKELRAMQRAYWGVRRKAVVSELQEARRVSEYLQDLQAAKDRPLQQRILLVEDGVRSSQAVDVAEGYGQDRVEWLERCLTECDAMLSSFKPEEVHV